MPVPESSGRAEIAVPATEHALFPATCESAGSPTRRSPQIVGAGSTWLTKEAALAGLDDWPRFRRRAHEEMCPY